MLLMRRGYRAHDLKFEEIRVLEIIERNNGYKAKAISGSEGFGISISSEVDPTHHARRREASKFPFQFDDQEQDVGIESSTGNCEDCGNFSEYLIIDLDGSWKCERCLKRI